MTWEYALIGLVVGIVIGAVAMRFGNRKLRQQQVLQNELEKSKTDLEEYRQELVGHFARSASSISIWRKAPITYYRTYRCRIIHSATV